MGSAARRGTTCVFCPPTRRPAGRTGVYHAQQMLRWLAPARLASAGSLTAAAHAAERVRVARRLVRQLPATNWLRVDPWRWERFNASITELGDSGHGHSALAARMRCRAWCVGRAHSTHGVRAVAAAPGSWTCCCPTWMWPSRSRRSTSCCESQTPRCAPSASCSPRCTGPRPCCRTRCSSTACPAEPPTARPVRDRGVRRRGGGRESHSSGPIPAIAQSSPSNGRPDLKRHLKRQAFAELLVGNMGHHFLYVAKGPNTPGLADPVCAARPPHHAARRAGSV